MTNATLPVPVRLALPEHWEQVDPTAWGVRNAALLAVRRDLADDYTPTITVSGDWRTDDVPVDRIADESVAKLVAEGASDVELVKRRQVGGEHTPTVLQTIGATIEVGGRRFDLRQLQVVNALVDVERPERRVVLIYTLSCTFGQLDAMGREFQQVMASVEVAPPAAPGPPV